MGNAPALAEIARAARILAVRSRREAAGVAGRRLAQRVPRRRHRVRGVASLRTRRRRARDRLERHRAHRHTVGEALPRGALVHAADRARCVGVDGVSARPGRTKAQVAAHAAALLAASAAQAGDPVGLLVFGDGVRREIPPGRGDAHTWRVVRAAAECARRSARRHRSSASSPSGWARTLGAARWSSSSPTSATPRSGRRPLAALGRRHDLVAAVVGDPRERELVAAGGVRARRSRATGASLPVRHEPAPARRVPRRRRGTPRFAREDACAPRAPISSGSTAAAIRCARWCASSARAARSGGASREARRCRVRTRLGARLRERARVDGPGHARLRAGGGGDRTAAPAHRRRRGGRGLGRDAARPSRAPGEAARVRARALAARRRGAAARSERRAPGAAHADPRAGARERIPRVARATASRSRTPAARRRSWWRQRAPSRWSR